MFDSVGKKKKKIVNYKRHSFTNEKVINFYEYFMIVN